MIHTDWLITLRLKFSNLHATSLIIFHFIYTTHFLPKRKKVFISFSVKNDIELTKKWMGCLWNKRNVMRRILHKFNITGISLWLHSHINVGHSKEQHSFSYTIPPPTQFPRVSEIIKITVTPSFHNNQPLSCLSSIREKWFLNLSGIFIPNHIQCLLQLGENFALPTIHKKEMTFEFIINIERNIKKLNESTQNVRNRSIPVINNLSSFSPHNSTISNKLLNLTKQAKQFLHNNPNIILTKADKGNITVALDKNTYTNKINDML